ncbi:hypothetical protein DMJ13_10895 [halophilic archaeon]|nr:hypothetical protein DMJ13_10895 [halophilic archaeon]
MASIRGYGSYVPLYRIERASIAEQHDDHASGGETAVPACEVRFVDELPRTTTGKAQKFRLEDRD